MYMSWGRDASVQLGGGSPLGQGEKRSTEKMALRFPPSPRAEGGSRCGPGLPGEAEPQGAAQASCREAGPGSRSFSLAAVSTG